MKFSVFCLVAALASQADAVSLSLEQAAQNTPAINIIDNARIMMLPGSVPGMGCGCSMAQLFSEKADEIDEVLAQKDDLVTDDELLGQVSSLVGLDADTMLENLASESGIDKEGVLAQLRTAENSTELVQMASSLEVEDDQ